MKTIITRTNQRDLITYHLSATDGVPLCPHCGTPMTRLGDSFENSQCGCWWHGASSSDYALQVVVAATDEQQAEYVAGCAQRARAREVESAAAAAKFEEARQIIADLGGTVRISARKSRGRGGNAWADLPAAAANDPRIALIPQGLDKHLSYQLNYAG